jgi:hypothetical protein
MTKQEEFRQSIINQNIEDLNLLIKHKRVDPSFEDNWAIIYASDNGCINVVKILLNDKRVNPADYCNYSIRLACKNRISYIGHLLWKDERVKKTLEKDDFKLYNKLMLKDIKNKVNEF